MPNQANSSQIIIFQFHGGTRDGRVVRSDQPTEDQDEAHKLWALTWSGMVGRRFDVSSPNGPTRQRYQVSDKYESDQEIHVMCQHVAED
jgi:hypothetical protein